MSQEVERYLKIKEEISEVEKKAAGLEAELKGATQQRDEILKKYGLTDVGMLKKLADDLRVTIKGALDHWEGMIANVQNNLGPR